MPAGGSVCAREAHSNSAGPAASVTLRLQAPRPCRPNFCSTRGGGACHQKGRALPLPLESMPQESLLLLRMQLQRNCANWMTRLHRSWLLLRMPRLDEGGSTKQGGVGEGLCCHTTQQAPCTMTRNEY